MESSLTNIASLRSFVAYRTTIGPFLAASLGVENLILRWFRARLPHYLTKTRRTTEHPHLILRHTGKRSGLGKARASTQPRIQSGQRHATPPHRQHGHLQLGNQPGKRQCTQVRHRSENQTRTETQRTPRHRHQLGPLPHRHTRQRSGRQGRRLPEPPLKASELTARLSGSIKRPDPNPHSTTAAPVQLEWLHKIHKAESPRCTCGAIQSGNHIVFTCPQYRIARQALYTKADAVSCHRLE